MSRKILVWTLAHICYSNLNHLLVILLVIIIVVLVVCVLILHVYPSIHSINVDSFPCTLLRNGAVAFSTYSVARILPIESIKKRIIKVSRSSRI